VIQRLIGALTRAVALVLIMAAPAFLLPEVSVASQEITLVVAGIAAAFTIFEYASTHPVLIDFRFAPPYNRMRFLIFGVQVFALVFLCRAHAGQDAFSGAYLASVDQIVATVAFPLSPVSFGAGIVTGGASAAFDDLVLRAAALSFAVTIVPLVVFGLLLWVMGWPVKRRDFNLWVNLPTFEPVYGAEVPRRLSRDGRVNLIAGIASLYLLPFILAQIAGMYGLTAELNYQPVVWGATVWAFVSGSLIIRGLAILKIAHLVSRVQRA
jgi:hypothetical protein